MKVSDIKGKGQVDEITLKVVSKGDPREVRGGSLKVCDCTCEDDSGKIKVTLWNDDIDKVSEGTTIKITKGWSQEYQGELQLSSGRFGTLEIIE
ncbi:MAG: OB-fold nucleic acid binding domain-containing protein [archaeon]